MASDLKPCPFCGGEAKIRVKPNSYLGNKYIATCKSINCIGRVYKEWCSEAMARTAWNRRADDGK